MLPLAYEYILCAEEFKFQRARENEHELLLNVHGGRCILGPDVGCWGGEVLGSDGI